MTRGVALLALALLAAGNAPRPSAMDATAQGYRLRLEVAAPDPALPSGPENAAQLSRMMPPGGPGRGHRHPPAEMMARAGAQGGGGGGGTHVGPLALLDVGKPNHSVRLYVRDRDKANQATMARLVAIETRTYDVAVTPLHRTATPGEFAANVALPGKGPYKLVVRLLTREGPPVVAKFDYHE